MLDEKTLEKRFAQGRGIEAQNIEKVFEPYSSSQPMGKNRGTGLGMSMARLTALNPKIKAIVASGYSEDVAMEGYRSFGVADSLAKPISVQNLKKILEKLL